MRIRYSRGKRGQTLKKAFVYELAEHGIDPGVVDADALRIVDRLTSNGHETYIVGGAVRDLMLGKVPKDFDIVTNATPSRIRRLFHNSRVIGRRFRLVHIFFGPKVIEVSTFRSLENGTTSNTYGRVEDDVRRRDFTLNALLYDPRQKTVIDYVGGVEDIRKKRMRPVIALQNIFVDDPVRLLRAVKYAALFDFHIPLLLGWKIRSQAELLKPVSSSRLTEEILKIIKTGQAFKIIKELERFGLFRYLQPNTQDRFEQDNAFKAAYFASLVKMDELVAAREAKVAELIYYLIHDYLNSVMDWQLAIPELFKSTLKTARGFLQPMNPPRVELESAVKKLLAGRGIIYKKPRQTDSKAQNSPKLEAAKPGKSRRRRRPKKLNTNQPADEAAQAASDRGKR